MAEVTLGPVRLSWIDLFEPVDRNNDGRRKYYATLLIDKNDKKSLAALQEGVKRATEEGKHTKFNGSVPKKVPNPIHDGDGEKENGEAYGEECHGCYVMTASATEDYPPEIIAGRDAHQARPSEVYSGCYALVNITMAPYNYNGKKGIGAYLNNVWKTKDGDPLGSRRKSATEVFAGYADNIDFGEEDDGLFDGFEDEEVPF